MILGREDGYIYFLDFIFAQRALQLEEDDVHDSHDGGDLYRENETNLSSDGVFAFLPSPPTSRRCSFESYVTIVSWADRLPLLNGPLPCPSSAVPQITSSRLRTSRCGCTTFTHTTELYLCELHRQLHLICRRLFHCTTKHELSEISLLIRYPTEF